MASKPVKLDHLAKLDSRLPAWMASFELNRRAMLLAIEDCGQIKLITWTSFPRTEKRDKTKTKKISRSKAVTVVAGSNEWAFELHHDMAYRWSVSFVDQIAGERIKTFLEFTPRKESDTYVSQVLASPDARRMIEIVIAETFSRGNYAEGVARLDAGLNPNSVIRWNGERRSLISLAAEAKTSCVVEALLARGANPDGMPGTRSPLFAAWDYRTLYALLHAGADPTAKNKSGNMLDKDRSGGGWDNYELAMIVYAIEKKTGSSLWAQKDFLKFILERSFQICYVNSDPPFSVLKFLSIDQAKEWVDQHFEKIDFVEPEIDLNKFPTCLDPYTSEAGWKVSFRCDSHQENLDIYKVYVFFKSNPRLLLTPFKEKVALESIPAAPTRNSARL